MSSKLEATYQSFEKDNADLAPRLTAFLTGLCQDTDTHARFMNTLSMLEQMGSQRIMLTQGAHRDMLDEETLKHIAEEARHAFFFKRQANRFAKKELAYVADDMIAPAQAAMYFKRLERFILSDLEQSDLKGLAFRRAIYLYMSLTIEYRAVWGYGHYQAVLEAQNVKLSLKSLLAEEEGHLDQMAEALMDVGAFSEARIRRFCQEETRLYKRLFDRLEEEALMLPKVA